MSSDNFNFFTNPGFPLSGLVNFKNAFVLYQYIIYIFDPTIV